MTSPLNGRLEALTAEEAIRAWNLDQALMRAQRAIAAASNERRAKQRMPVDRLRHALAGAVDQLDLYEAASIAADRLRAQLNADDAEREAWVNRTGPYKMTPGGARA